MTKMSDQKTKKAKRRSSFTANRVSLLARDVSSAKDLHSMVEDELSKEERLAKLSRLCLQHTFDSLAKEFKDYSWFETFQNQADESTNNLISTLRDDDVFAHACDQEQQLPNPANDELTATINTLEGKINELEHEKQKWNSTLETLKEKRREIEHLKNVLNVSYIIQDFYAPERKSEKLEIRPEDLSEEVKSIAWSQYMKPRPDYEDLIQSTRTSLNKSALQMEVFCTRVELVDRTTKVADTVEDRLKHQLYDESFKGIKDQNSMEPISNLISLPSSPKANISCT